MWNYIRIKNPQSKIGGGNKQSYTAKCEINKINQKS